MDSTIVRKFQCMKCGHEWDAPFGSGRQIVCPQCRDMRIRRTNPEVGPPCGRRKGRGRGPGCGGSD